MSKISRQDNKKRFKTGMYPTQQDFENLFDSYVHKDDTIEPSQIVSGSENIVDIINRKAEESHSHAIADVNGLQAFIDEMTGLLEIVRDPETGVISQSKLKTLTESLAALRDDVDTNEDNIAGHEIRITSNTAALEDIYTILGKDANESITDLVNRFAALQGNYANVYSFVQKVKNFLESTDASDETINRWQEIESFLQGITDTQTLTGLLANLRQEILSVMPQGNYLEQVSDLDSYTDAEDGKIVQYVGQTNEKYTRGFCYERTQKTLVEQGEQCVIITADNPNNQTPLHVNSVLIPTNKHITYTGDYAGYVVLDTEPRIGGTAFVLGSNQTMPITEIISEDSTKWVLNDGIVIYKNSTEKIVLVEPASGDEYIIKQYDNIFDYSDIPITDVSINRISDYTGTDTLEITIKHSDTSISTTSWQHIPTSPVIY